MLSQEQEVKDSTYLVRSPIKIGNFRQKQQRLKNRDKRDYAGSFRAHSDYKCICVNTRKHSQRNGKITNKWFYLYWIWSPKYFHYTSAGNTKC